MAKLYMVATPIGNLGDITLRALEILKSVDMIAAEDTRVTKKLLSHFDISKPVISYHEYSDRKKAEHIINDIIGGKNIAFVSDAGTPAVSDPGRMLVAVAREMGVEVEGIPGACAAVCAYSVSGIMDKRFVFYGFLDDKQGAREKQLVSFSSFGMPVIIYVSPHKLLKTLADIGRICGSDTRVTVLREITKLHEEYVAGTPDTLSVYFTEKEPRGEFVLILEIPEKEMVYDDDCLRAEAEKLVLSGMSVKEASKLLSERTGVSKNRIYKTIIGG